MFNRLRRGVRRNRRRAEGMAYGLLEGKRLLAGNVTVANTDNLYIRGDSADNQIEIIGNDDGTISIFGTNGTTINGEAGPLVIDGDVVANNNIGVRASYEFGLRANVGRGDDSVIVEGVEFGGSSIVYGGPGDDSVGTYQTTFSDRLLLQTFTGDDSVSIDKSQIAGDLFLLTLNGNDTIGIDASELLSNAFVIAGNGIDNLALRDSSVNDQLLVLSQNGNDYVSVENLRVATRTGVYGGDGNDEISIDYSGVDDFVSPIRIGGQSDFDRFELDVSSALEDAIMVNTFEREGIEDNADRKAAVFNELIVSGARLGTVTELAVLTPDLSTLTGAVVQTGLAGTLNDTPNLTVLAPLNSAFAKLPDGTLEGLSNDQLTDILTFHVAGEVIFASDLVTRTTVDTLLGTSFSVEVGDDGVLLNDNVTIAATDIRAKNGVVHLLNEVLIPQV